MKLWPQPPLMPPCTSAQLRLQVYFHNTASSLRSSPRFQQNRYRLVELFRSRNRDYLTRSALGYIAVLNILPNRVFDDPKADIPTQASVKIFQQNLTALLRRHTDMPDWSLLFSPVL